MQCACTPETFDAAYSSKYLRNSSPWRQCEVSAWLAPAAPASRHRVSCYSGLARAGHGELASFFFIPRGAASHRLCFSASRSLYVRPGAVPRTSRAPAGGRAAGTVLHQQQQQQQRTADSGPPCSRPRLRRSGSRQAGFQRSTATSLRGGRHLSDVPMTRLLLAGRRTAAGAAHSAVPSIPSSATRYCHCVNALCRCGFSRSVGPLSPSA
ncbi:hypothetical protein OH76DRAFT_843352 [Lentinus brumalis]|uniref:Uncharacterized protein n=1 Tax=Lentinus brumalis TaxID=2498619 RepID=A0A371D1Q8_9APHY|nr:hypothetical protein OH76DRAFT_843352 [Polyporus brumalis]